MSTLRTGSSVSHYKVVSAIGAGGMGEVYKAHDDSLERNVALKILPPELVKNEERVRRFVQEAKSASSLSHPHIVTIYEIGQAEVHNEEEDSQSVHFIAMELIDGSTLTREIHEERRDLRTLLGYLAQAADALAKAHAAGIIHRDLKPENIMISRDGYAKVLDFGLAKLTEKRGPEGSTNAPTAVQQQTREGVVMGTVGYMSPEQVQGKVVDFRSDIFSFGCILYEAATRQRPFDADTDVDIMHKILHDKPQPVDEISPDVPPELRRMIRRCLAKEPEKRFQSMKDIAFELSDIVEEWEQLSPSRSSGSISGAAAAVSQPKRNLALWSAIALAAVIGIGGLAFGIYQSLRKESGTTSERGFGSMKLARLTSSGNAVDAAISPDGKYVAHVILDAGRWSLRVKQVATGSDVEVLDPVDTRINGLTFSQDGDYIYYYQQEKVGRGYSILYQIPTLGGTARKVLFDIDTLPSFSPDGKRVTFNRGYPQSGEGAVMIANADGSGERKLAVRKEPETYMSNSAVWSPDGKHIATVAVSIAGGAHMRAALLDVATGKETPLGNQRFQDLLQLQWLPDASGLLAVATDSPSATNHQIWLLPFPDGAPRRVSNDLNDYARISITADGRTIAATQATWSSNLWIAPPGNPSAARQVTTGSGMKVVDLFATANGILFTNVGDKATSIWKANADGSELRALVEDGKANWGPSAPTDGSFVVFTSTRNGDVPHLFRVDRDGSNLKQLTKTPAFFDAPSASPDGKWVVYSSIDRILMRIPATGGEGKSFGGLAAGEPVRVATGIHHTSDGRFIGLVTYGKRPDGLQENRPGILSSEGGAPTLFPFEIRGPIYKFRPEEQSATFLRNVDGVWNLWRQPLPDGEPQQITKFTSGRIQSYAWGPGGTLYLGRGEESSDVVLISDFR